MVKKIMSDVGGNFILEKFKEFCTQQDKEQASSSSQHQSKGQEEACIKFLECTLKKYVGNKADPYIILLQIGSTPHGQGELHKVQYAKTQ